MALFARYPVAMASVRLVAKLKRTEPDLYYIYCIYFSPRPTPVPFVVNNMDHYRLFAFLGVKKRNTEWRRVSAGVQYLMVSSSALDFLRQSISSGSSSGRLLVALAATLALFMAFFVFSLFLASSIEPSPEPTKSSDKHFFKSLKQ